MKNKILTRFAVAAGAAVACAGTSTVQAQSVDALLDKLVDKGILSVKEANDLKDETDKGFNAAYSVKSGMPDWVNSLKFNGDVRGRYDGIYFDQPFAVNRNRYRYRVRLGATAVMKDNFEVGLQLSSSDPVTRGGGVGSGDPISGNTTFQDNGSGKFVYLYQAYGKWTPLTGPDWFGNVTIGKMANPFVFSPMVFDYDYNPEGAAAQLSYNFCSKHTLSLTSGGFVLDEVSASSSDPYMLGTQLRWDAAWNKHWQSSVGIAALFIDNEDQLGNAAVPNQNTGNTRKINVVGTTTNQVPAYKFNPIVADASLTYMFDSVRTYAGPFPIKAFGDYINNPGAPDGKNTGYDFGIMFGKAGKKGQWEVSYRYERLESDAWYEEVVDSDFGAFYATPRLNSGFNGYGAGTNVKGHIVRAAYSPYDSLTLSATYFMTELIDMNPADVISHSKSGTGRLQLDAMWKF
jgi:Putative porin